MDTTSLASSLFEIRLGLPAMVGLMVTVLIAAWTDLSTWRIPNRLLAPSAAGAVMLALFHPSAIGVADALLGGLTGLLVFMPLYALRGMAAGDVKLMAVIGLYAGTKAVIAIALLTCLIGGLWVMAVFALRRPESWISVLQMLLFRLEAKLFPRRHLATTTKGKSGKEMIPYGAVIAAGTGMALLIGGL